MLILPTQGLAEALRSSAQLALSAVKPVALSGRVVEARGTLIRAVGVDVSIGDLCELRLSSGEVQLAEVTGLADEGALLMPHGELIGLSLGARVVPLRHGQDIAVGDALLGRVLNGYGRPIDDGALLDADDIGMQRMPIRAAAPDPLRRQPIEHTFDTGVRAIDALITLGQGQRVGIFAPAGVGKSTLAGMIVRAADVDVCVIALVGERGREVGEFINHTLGPEGMSRSVVVAATSDSAPAERVNASFVATTIAEYFRDQGYRVLLVLDSVTRLARALREVGLANGEPPARRGFPPSVFAALPRLMERAGNGVVGSMSAIYTVLTEGEDDDDPVAEEVRSILDGHIVLTRAVAQQAQYPAIDVLASLSRLMPMVVSAEQLSAAQRLRALLARYREVELLVQVGEYRAGSDPLADEALAKRDRIRQFLSQKADECVPADSARTELMELLE